MFKPGGKQGPVVEKRPKNCPNDGFLGSTLSIGGRSLIVTKFLAQGGFAFIYTATNPANLSEVYAVKRMIIQTRDALRDSLLETYYHTCFNNHPNVVRLYAARVAGHETELIPEAVTQLCNAKLAIPSEIVLLMELCTGGSLVDLMQRAPNERFKEEFVWHAFGRVVSTVCMMGTMGIINRDLKIENLLMSFSGGDTLSPSMLTAKHAEYIKVCDFGSCTKTQYPDGSVFTKDLALRTKVENEIQKKTTPSYRAPEMIDFFSKFPITIRSDVFALGVILFRMMYFSLPFPDGEVLANYNCKYRVPTSPNFSDALKNLISVSLVKDPMQRADVWYLAAEIYNKTGIAFTPRPGDLHPAQPIGQAMGQTSSQIAFQPAQQIMDFNASAPTPADPGANIDFGFASSGSNLGGLTRESSCSSLPDEDDAPLFGFNNISKPTTVPNVSAPKVVASTADAPFGFQVVKSNFTAAQGFQLGASGTAAAPAFAVSGGSQQPPALPIPPTSPTVGKGVPSFAFGGKPMFAAPQQQMQQTQQMQPLSPTQSSAVPAFPQFSVMSKGPTALAFPMAASPASPAASTAPQFPFASAPAAAIPAVPQSQSQTQSKDTNLNQLLDFFSMDSGASSAAQQPMQPVCPAQQTLSSQTGSIQVEIPASDMKHFNMMTPEQRQVYTQQLQMQQMFAMQANSSGM